MLRISPALARYAEKQRKQRKQIERLKQRSKNELESLSPGFRRKIETILAHLEGKGWTPVVFHGERTKEEQAKIVKAGHSKTMQSFHVQDTSLNRGRNGLYWQVKGEAADIVAKFPLIGPTRFPRMGTTRFPEIGPTRFPLIGPTCESRFEERFGPVPLAVLRERGEGSQWRGGSSRWIDIKKLSDG